jgi:dipeptidyl aminopeptidase/acylaminoacyl peptidase
MNMIRNLRRTLGLLALLAAQAQAAATSGEELRAFVAAQRAAPAASQLPRSAFLESRRLLAVRLSPSGAQVASLRDQGDSRAVWLLPTAGGPARLLVARTQAQQLYWSQDGRWIFLRGANSLSTVGVDGRAGVRFALGGVERRQPIKVDPSQASAMLLRERVAHGTGERWRILRVDEHGRRTFLREDARWIHDIALDAQGKVVALLRFEGDHDALYRVRPDGSLREVLRLQPMEKLSLLAASPDGSLLMEGNPGGTTPAGNFRRVLRLGADDKLQTLHQDPRGQADLDEVVFNPSTRQPLAASYRSAVAATIGLGSAQQVVADIVGKFPGRDLALQAGSAANAPWLVSERAATLRDPRWYLYEPRKGQTRRILEEAGIAASAPAESSLAGKIAIAYTASDGRRVYGFLVLPPGVDVAHAPLVAQVHGGPINHFRAGYDGVAQFLANRGYIVFQSNFRGSTGLGRDYTFAAKGDYGNGRVQQDIVEGVRWLLARGIGDPERVGIVGHSFGGYSALVGLSFQPELFKVGVAGAPPADLAWSMRWLIRFGDQGDLPDRSLQLSLKALSLDPSEPATQARLHTQSPLSNANKMRRPLLVMAGGADRTVAFREVSHYVATLRTLGAPVSLLVEPGGGHSPTDPIPREAYLYAMEAMLHRYLGGAAPEPPGQGLRDYLRRNLRLVDKDVQF